MAVSDSYKEPNFTVISKYDNIEIRQYDKYVIAKTSIPNKNSSLDDNMFSVLAGYIFGGNNQGKSIPMTTPVITKESDSSYDMIFFMLNSNTPNDLPRPNSSKINLETFSMGKIISIRFGMWATEDRVLKYKTILGALQAREKLGSTNMGNGVAIPHGRVENLTSPIATLVLIKPAFVYDKKTDPVDIILGLLAPKDADKQHIEALSTFADRLCDIKYREKLRESNNNKELYSAAISAQHQLIDA